MAALQALPADKMRWGVLVVALLVLSPAAYAVPLSRQHFGENALPGRILHQSGPVPIDTSSIDGTTPIGIAAPGVGYCNAAMYPTTCTIPGTATAYCCPSGYSCFPGSGYECYKQNADGSFPSTPDNFDCSKIIEITIDDIQASFAAGELTSRALVECYLKRIADYDKAVTFTGQTAYPTNSVLEIDPNVLSLAEEKDAERMACLPNCNLSKLHGIPIGIKDNICADGLNCTAGSYNLLGSIHKQAPIVDLLKYAGGIIMAKMALSEWAFYRSSNGVSGWSGRGGQVYSPYTRYQPTNISTNAIPYADIPSAIPYNQTFTNIPNPTIVSGSSGGSAVGAATNMIAVTVGSETGGSVLSPARVNGVVGFRPTIGVMSRNGIVPLSSTQDTAGPICRSVADCLYMFDAMAYDDPADPVHSGSTPWLPIYTRPQGGYLPYLNINGLAGKKIAIYSLPASTTGPAVAAYAALPDQLRSRGATVDVLPPTFTFLSLGGSVLALDFKVDMNAFLEQLTWQPGYTPLKTLTDLIQYNKDNYELEFQGGLCCRGDPAFALYYQQSWEQSNVLTDKRDPTYLGAKQNSSMIAASITDWFQTNGYDAVASNGALIGTWARVGFPGISLPCPLGVNAVGTPQGLNFHGYPYNEGDIFAMAYDVEQNLCGSGRPLPTYCNGISC